MRLIRIERRPFGYQWPIAPDILAAKYRILACRARHKNYFGRLDVLCTMRFLCARPAHIPPAEIPRSRVPSQMSAAH